MRTDNTALFTVVSLLPVPLDKQVAGSVATTINNTLSLLQCPGLLSVLTAFVYISIYQIQEYLLFEIKVDISNAQDLAPSQSNSCSRNEIGNN